MGNPEQVAKWLSNDAEAINAVAPRSTELAVDAIINCLKMKSAPELAISPRAHATLRGLAILFPKNILV